MEERSGGQGSIWKVKAGGSTGNEIQEDPGHLWHREMSIQNLCAYPEHPCLPGPWAWPVLSLRFP